MRRASRKTEARLIRLKKSLDASLLGLANVVANCYLGSGRVARLDCIDNRAVFQQGRLAAFAASTACRLQKKHRGLNIFEHLQNVAIVRAIIDRFVESAV